MSRRHKVIEQAAKLLFAWKDILLEGYAILDVFQLKRVLEVVMLPRLAFIFGSFGY